METKTDREREGDVKQEETERERERDVKQEEIKKERERTGLKLRLGMSSKQPLD